MNHLLIVTYVLDEHDPVLAWQLSVVRELAARVPRVTVLTERRGTGALPDNARVIELPHRPYHVPRRAGGGWLAAPRVVRALKTDPPDACVVHMASEWLYRLGWVLRRLNVPTVLWYAHGTVSRRLRLAVRYADVVITSTDEGFRVATPKKRVIGQGIDVSRFRRPDQAVKGHVVLYVGRLSRRKRLDLVIAAMARALRTAPDRGLRLRLVGPPLTKDDEAYVSELRVQAQREGIADAIEWAGFVPHDQVVTQYRDVFLHLNLSETGSMDKTVMEALAARTPVLTSNPALRSVLADYPWMLIESDDVDAISERILEIHERRQETDYDALPRLLEGRHDLASYGDRILTEVSRAVAHREGSAT